MEHLKKAYSIAFAGLKNGKHEFDYEVKDTFFDQIEHSLLNKANMNVGIILDKHDTMLILDFTFKGTIGLECDRCNDPFDLKVEGKNKLIVKLSDEDFSEEDEIVTIPRNDGILNIAPYIYEFMSLMIPLKKVHPDVKDCNQETISILEALSRKKETEENDGTDPRWNVLKNYNKN